MVWAAALGAAIGFQQFVIGMPLADAKTVELPADRWGDKAIKCSDQSDAPKSLVVTPAERKLGVVACWPTHKIGDSLTRAGVSVSPDIEATAEFRFVSGHLFRIETHYDYEHEAALIDSLVAKYGAPSATGSDEVQNAFGVRVPRVSMVWATADAQIALLSPSMTLRRLTVTYEHKGDAAIIDQAVLADERARIEL